MLFRDVFNSFFYVLTNRKGKARGLCIEKLNNTFFKDSTSYRNRSAQSVKTIQTSSFERIYIHIRRDKGKTCLRRPMTSFEPLFYNK